jgi:hypothetical protein
VDNLLTGGSLLFLKAWAIKSCSLCYTQTGFTPLAAIVGGTT